MSLVFVFATLGGAIAQGGETNGNTKTFIAYVRDYRYVRPLEGVENDAAELSIVVSKFNTYANTTLFANSDAADDSETGPRDSFVSKFDNWLESLTEDDFAIAYLTGHGVLDDEGKVHFALPNIKCDKDGRPLNTAEAAYPMEEFRNKFNNCKASKKLLILDCCHSGALDGQKGGDGGVIPRNAKSKNLISVFQEASAVTTFASSRGDEYSHMMTDNEHSLFTFWLIYGLRGYADENLDGKVTLKELSDYVSEHVETYVETTFNGEQTQTPQTTSRLLS